MSPPDYLIIAFSCLHSYISIVNTWHDDIKKRFRFLLNLLSPCGFTLKVLPEGRGKSEGYHLFPPFPLFYSCF
jgi:hypothetical protein